MKIVLVNQAWPVFGGSETYLLSVASELQRLGHTVFVAALAAGPVVEEAQGRGQVVVTHAADLPNRPDVVLTQDAQSAYEMAMRFADARRVYVAHSPIFEPQLPPLLAEACHAVVALNDGTARQAAALANQPEVVRLRQPVDLDRFIDRGPPRHRPQRVLLFGNHFGDRSSPNHRIVGQLCDEQGLELEQIGAGGRTSMSPEIEIARADIVVGLGRCVIEAMASARPAYVLGNRGADGWVTAPTYAQLEGRAFAGGGTGRAIGLAELREDFALYDPEMGQVNRQLALANHDLFRHTSELVGLFRRLPGGPVETPAPLDVLARMVRVQWETGNRLSLALGDAAALRTANERLQGELNRAQEQGREAQVRLDLLQSSASWRITAPLRRLKATAGRRRTSREG